MKRYIAAVSLLFMFAVVAGEKVTNFSGVLPEAQTPGRFQLVAATHDIVDKVPIEKHSLFRIDTATGKVWRLVSVRVHTGGNMSDIDGWSPVFEDMMENLAAIERASTNQIK